MTLQSAELKGVGEMRNGVARFDVVVELREIGVAAVEHGEVPSILCVRLTF